MAAPPYASRFSHKGIGLDDPAYPLRLAVIATGSRERSRPSSDMFLVLRAETCAKAGCAAGRVTRNRADRGHLSGHWRALGAGSAHGRPSGIGRLTLPRRPQAIATSGGDHNIYFRAQAQCRY